MSRTAAIIIAFVLGLFMMIQFFIPHPAVTGIYNTLLDIKQIVLGCAFILGVLSLIRFHAGRIRQKQAGGWYSSAALLGLAVMVVMALVWGTEDGPYRWMFNNVQAPMQATMFSLLAFFVASAAYRAFRVRNLDASVLLAVGVVVMLGRVTLGTLLSWDIGGQTLSLAGASEWILHSVNVAAKRGILIGVGLGMIATALRIIIGLERTYLGRD
ncbi:MAG: hypothetical protein KAW17_00490 [Candidatus Eisenbacteria sp.]|nr:hypothetical protein [Candidatus Eisenbacteria bacterium]